MRAYVGITDNDWYEMLSGLQDTEEVNFWQPAGTSVFRVLDPGELFLFKLHSPLNYIVGGGIFAYSTLMPLSLAWEAFGQKNGATTLAEMRQRIERYRRAESVRGEDFTIGCILLQSPFFFPRADWISTPAGWSRNIVRGKKYDLTVEPGVSLWHALQERIHISSGHRATVPEKDDAVRVGKPLIIMPRLGQGSFRLIVTDVYRKRCAVTQERTLPVLEAAHIVPCSAGGTHDVSNGLLLRSDLHTLFDRGYVTVSPGYHLHVSRRIREEFENGRDYYALHGRSLHVPGSPTFRPRLDHLEWHNNEVYLE